jgi:hypothetical protein
LPYTHAQFVDEKKILANTFPNFINGSLADMNEQDSMAGGMSGGSKTATLVMVNSMIRGTMLKKNITN